MCRSVGRRLLCVAGLTFPLFFSTPVRADVGLVIETPTGLLGFLSDVGHVSVWLSHACLLPSGHVAYCEHSSGVVFTSTAYWPNPGAAGIPAELFFLGARSGAEGRTQAAWTHTLGSVYPDVEPAEGAKYLGRAWLRSLRVMKFATTEAEDRRVLAEIDASQTSYRYSYRVRNCAFYAQAILQRYFGPDFHENKMLELGIDTPRAVERALRHHLKETKTEFEVVRFRGRFRHLWRQPSRNICEAAVLDPKYAIPMLIYQPYLFAGFAGCYAAIRISTWSRARHLRYSFGGPQVALAKVPGDQRLDAFESLTGQTPWRVRAEFAATSPEVLLPQGGVVSGAGGTTLFMVRSLPTDEK